MADICSLNSSDFIIMEEVCDDILTKFPYVADICSFNHYPYSGK